MVDNQGGGSMMYLPLDKILERQNTTSSSQLPMNATQNALEGLRNAATVDRQNVTSPSGGLRSNNNGRTGR